MCLYDLGEMQASLVHVRRLREANGGTLDRAHNNLLKRLRKAKVQLQATVNDFFSRERQRAQNGPSHRGAFLRIAA